MGDDLISRKEILNFMRNWQTELKGIEHKREYNLVDQFIKGVENQHTAYDVDKVVEQLGVAFEAIVAEILDGTGSEFTIGDFNIRKYTDVLTGIVRSGYVESTGAETKTAKWKEHFAKRFGRFE